MGLSIPLRVKAALRAISPPILWATAGKIRRSLGRGGEVPEWEVVPHGWDGAETKRGDDGWLSPGVVRTYRAKWERYTELVESTGPLGFVHEADLRGNEDVRAHNVVMSFAYALGRGALESERPLSLLDWGGGCGHYLALARALYPGLDLEYHCRDLAPLVRLGRDLLPDARFHDEDRCFDRAYDIVVASAAMQYERDWEALLGRFARSARRYVYVANLPVVENAEPFVFVQRPYAYGYDTEYRAWCLNRARFLAAGDAAGLRLVREFHYDYTQPVRGAPEPVRYRGFLFSTAAPGSERRK